MHIEIERKFLVDTKLWTPSTQGIRIKQAYLAEKGCTLRVRIADTKAYLTIKGPTTGCSRQEYEYPIPLQDAEQMIKLALYPPIEKVRYIEIIGGKKWEIDVFEGSNAPLVMAEIELESEQEDFERPSWLGAELSHDRRYTNASLSKQPFGSWMP